MTIFLVWATQWKHSVSSGIRVTFLIQERQTERLAISAVRGVGLKGGLDCNICPSVGRRPIAASGKNIPGGKKENLEKMSLCCQNVFSRPTRSFLQEYKRRQWVGWASCVWLGKDTYRNKQSQAQSFWLFLYFVPFDSGTQVVQKSFRLHDHQKNHRW